MDALSWFQAVQPHRAPFVPADVAAGLRRLRWTQIRHSAYATGRECPQRLAIMLATAPPVTSYSVHVLCGTVFHLAFLDPALAAAHAGNARFWQGLFREARARDPQTTFHYRGTPVTWEFVRALCDRFASADRLGIALGELVGRLGVWLQANGFTVEAAEHRLDVDAGHGISFYGTEDLVVRKHNLLGVLDVKTTGLWSPYLEEDGQVAGQSYSVADVQWHSQLRHYDWLRVRAGLLALTYVGLLLPVNLIPYKIGPKKGRPRGEAGILAPAQGDRLRAAYEVDLLTFLRSVSRPEGIYRALPVSYGKPACPGCPYFTSCLADIQSASQAAYLQDAALDYLRTDPSDQEDIV